FGIRPFAVRECDERDLDVLERITIRAARRRIAQALHAGFDDVRRQQRRRRQRILELHTGAARSALHFARRQAVDRLLFEIALELGGAFAIGEHGLAIDDLRLARARLHAVLALHAVDDDLEVELAHARDDRLAGLG